MNIEAYLDEVWKELDRFGNTGVWSFKPVTFVGFNLPISLTELFDEAGAVGPSGE